MFKIKNKNISVTAVEADLPAVSCCTWWGGSGGGLGQISCPASGLDPQAVRAPAGRTPPNSDSASAAPPEGLGPGLVGKCSSLYVGS